MGCDEINAVVQMGLQQAALVQILTGNPLVLRSQRDQIQPFDLGGCFNSYITPVTSIPKR
jgi:hypothetical protein